MDTTRLYDAFSADYDRFVNWPQRLAYELGFIKRQLEEVGAERLLDVACGTGQHAIALAKAGYQTEAADLSVEMVARARANAEARGVDLSAHVAGFGQLESKIVRGGARFDALTCLGNSLPHVLTVPDLDAALADMAQILRAGGRLVVQQRNFDKVIAERQRFMPPEAHEEGKRQWLFMRFYDWEPKGRLAFNVVRMERRVGEDWHVSLGRTWLYPWKEAELRTALVRAGFQAIESYGNLAGEPFVALESSDLVLVADRAG